MPLVSEYDGVEKRISALNTEFPDKLRKSILQQAVQGKLTERDPSDEPASELLKHIQMEKSKLIAEGRIKKEKQLPPITEDDCPYDLSDTWVWVRLGDIVQYQGGYAYKSDTYVKQSNNQVVRLGNVKNSALLLSASPVYIPNHIAEETDEYRIVKEAGAYKAQTTPEFRRRHPFYVRSNVMISMDDYMEFQKEMQTLNGMYEIPVGEEIKWSDLWEKLRNRPRTPAIAAITEDRLKGYYRKVFECASQKDSLQYIFTITNVYEQYCLLEERHVYKFHLQEAFQRVQMDLRPRNEFAVFIMDELNTETIKQIKAVCHEFTVNGDFIRNYGNVYHSILTESSNQSAGIQLADYAVGAMYGYLRRSFIAPDNYAFATDMYNDYIYRKLRHSAMGSIMGYGIREVPKHSTLRQNLAALFPDIQVDTAT